MTSPSLPQTENISSSDIILEQNSSEQHIKYYKLNYKEGEFWYDFILHDSIPTDIALRFHNGVREFGEPCFKHFDDAMAAALALVKLVYRNSAVKVVRVNRTVKLVRVVLEDMETTECVLMNEEK